ncbi:MAG: PD40 domain-containing protein, partial [Anaerolineae bacterium]|nr:PD40 domain-containing protein [Anaerolineae bacterium]
QALFAESTKVMPPDWQPDPVAPILPQPVYYPDARQPDTVSVQPSKRRWLGIAIAGAVLLIVATVVGILAFLGLLEPKAQVSTPTVAPSLTVHTVIPSDTPKPVVPSPTSKPTARVSGSNMRSSPTPVPTVVSTHTPIPVETLLAYVRGNVGSTDVYVADAEGQSQRCVACESCDEAEPAWFPDGSAVVYQSNCGESYDLWRVAVGRGSPVQITKTSTEDEREPDVSPDGQWIVYRSNADGSERNSDGALMVCDIEGGNVHGLGIRGRSPVWSPDGERIALMSEADGGWEIYVYAVRSGVASRLTSCSANCRWPDWSPDGQYVTYHSTTGANTTTADTIWYVPVNGGNAVRIVSGASAGRPSWSSTGWVVFNSDRGIEIARVDGSGRRTLIEEDMYWAPVWSR